MLINTKIRKIAEIIFTICGGWTGIMSGGLSIPYQIKFAASARGFARIEKEFNMEFFSDDGICKIALTPFVPPTKEEIRQKSEKAVEKLTEFSTVFFQP